MAEEVGKHLRWKKTKVGMDHRFPKSSRAVLHNIGGMVALKELESQTTQCEIELSKTMNHYFNINGG